MDDALDFVANRLNPTVIGVIFALSLAGRLVWRNKGWGLLAFGWLANQVYLWSESLKPVAEVAGITVNHVVSANLSLFSSAAFLGYAIGVRYATKRLLSVWQAFVLAGLLSAWSGLVTRNMTGAFFGVPEEGDWYAILPLYLPLIIFSSVAVILSGRTLAEYLRHRQLGRPLLVSIPMYCYGGLQFAYLFKFTDDKRLIVVAFAIALIMKATLAFGLLTAFKSQVEFAERSKEKTWQQLAFSWFAHELKSPVSVIQKRSLAVSHFIANNQFGKAKNQAEGLIRTTKTLRSVIGSVKLAAEPLDTERLTYFSVNRPLAAALSDVTEAYPEVTLSATTAYAKNMTVCAVEANLLQAFTNILRNAVEAYLAQANGEANDDNTIELRVQTQMVEREGREYIRATVIDCGPGIDDTIIDRVFRPYFSTKAGTNRGLGLFVVRNFVEMFNGRIGVKSPPPGSARGTLFEVFLPRVKTVDEDPREFLSRHSRGNK